VISIEGALCRQTARFPTRLDIGGNTPSCNEKRRSLFDAQDRVDRQREALIANIEGKLEQ
jgi:hypothetical protein